MRVSRVDPASPSLPGRHSIGLFCVHNLISSVLVCLSIDYKYYTREINPVSEMEIYTKI